MTQPVEPTEEEIAAHDFAAMVQEATAAFFQMSRDRHEMGQEKYGPVKFMEANTLEEAMEEIADLANYAMYTYVKLYILNIQVAKITGQDGEPGTAPVPLGATSFIKSGG